METYKSTWLRIVTHSIITILLLCSSPLTLATHEYENENENTIRSLKAIQSRIQATVRQAMPSVVSISDGIGFGSGVVVNKQGLILTAGHVVNGGEKEFTIYFPSGETANAKLMGYNLDVDTAMLQISDQGEWPFSEIADESSTQQGDWVVCLGHAGGYELGRLPPVRTGRILAIRDHQMITDAVLIGGDSGGPLFDLNGKVIAIHSSIGDNIAENRHVTIKTFQNDWTRLAAGEKWGSLPKFPDPIDDDKKAEPQNTKAKAKLGVVLDENPDRAIVKSVDAGSVAERVGIKAGDEVTSFDNQKISGRAALISLIRTKSKGDQVAIEIQRRQQTLKLQVILDELN